MKSKSKNLPFYLVLVTDLLSMIFALGPGIVGWGSSISYLKNIWDHECFLFLAPLTPLVLIFSFLIAVIFLRLFIPKMRPGVYPMKLNKGFASWYLTLSLGHAVRISGLQPFFFTFYTFKWLYWRAMGADIAFGINSSLFFTIVDFPLVTIKKGCSFGAYTHVACHTFVGDKLLLAPVVIEEDCYVGMEVTIGPKTTIGKGSWIGTTNRFFKSKLEPGTVIENAEWEYSDPKRKLNPHIYSPADT